MDLLVDGALGLFPLADWNHDGGGCWFLFPLFWIAVIVAIVVLARRRGWWGPGPRGQHRETAVELLERRFAEGQISGEEYAERRSTLDRSGGGA